METFNVGDAVVWYRQGKSGKVMSFSRNYGTIKRIDGDQALIVTGCGGRVTKPLARLTKKANDTPLAIFGGP